VQHGAQVVSVTTTTVALEEVFRQAMNADSNSNSDADSEGAP